MILLCYGIKYLVGRRYGSVFIPFDNLLDQKTYENIINTLQFHQLQCTCGHSGCLTIHGYYTRSLKKDDSEISLSICRVRCSHCGRTHALLPSLLVPYSQVSLQDQVSIISAYEASGDYEEIMAGTPSIDENLIASIIKRYVKHWMEPRVSSTIYATAVFWSETPGRLTWSQQKSSCRQLTIMRFSSKSRETCFLHFLRSVNLLQFL